MKRAPEEREESETKRTRVDAFPFLDLLPEMQGEVVACIPAGDLGTRAALARSCKRMHVLVFVPKLPPPWFSLWNDMWAWEPHLRYTYGNHPICLRHFPLAPVDTNWRLAIPEICWICSTQEALRFVVASLRLHTWTGVYSHASAYVRSNGDGTPELTWEWWDGGSDSTFNLEWAVAHRAWRLYHAGTPRSDVQKPASFSEDTMGRWRSFLAQTREPKYKPRDYHPWWE
jgi:hypothetical protein